LISKQVLSLDDWKKIQEKLKFIYATSNEISMIKKLQMMDIKVNSANNALGLIEQQILSPQYIQTNILRLSEEEIQQIKDDFLAMGAGGGAGGGADALGNAPMAGGMGGGEAPPGFGEVPDAQPNQQPINNTDKDIDTQTPETPTSRFKQKAKENSLPQDILENLKDGDIITNGKQKLRYENGKLKKI
jgi:hypothetical protein